MIVVKDDFLDSASFNTIKNILFSFEIPWYFYEYADDKELKDFFYCHMLYNDGQIKSNFFDPIALPILGKLSFKKLFRIKINMYTANPRIVIKKPGFHVDEKEQHRVALLNINSNDGYTEFENGEKFNSVENGFIDFDGKLKHRAISQTNTDVRINININYS